MTAIPALSRLRRASNNEILAERLTPPYTPLTWPGAALEPPTDVYAEVIDTDGAVYRSPNRRVDLALFRYKAGDDIAAKGGTFTRASSATYMDADGVLRTAAAGVLRDAHYVKNPVTGLMERTTLLEAQRTNLLPYSGDFSPWSRSAGVVLEPGVATDGVLSGTRITRPGSAASENVSHTLVVAAAADRYAARFHVRAGTLNAMSFGIYDTVVGTWLAQTARIVSGPGAVTTSGVSRVTGLSATETTVVEVALDGPATAGNRLSLLAYPGTTGVAEGSIVLFHAQGEQAAFSSSPILTNGAAVTRAADALSFVYPHAPKEMSVYARFVEGGTASGALGGRIAEMGGGFSQNSIIVRKFSPTDQRYSLRANNQTLGNSSEAAAAVPVGGLKIGDLVEVIGSISPNQATAQMAVNGVAGALVSGPATYTLPQAWGANNLVLGGAVPGFNAFTHFVATAQPRTLAQMRKIAGVTP